MTLEEERQRREAQLLRYEADGALLHQFIHGTPEETVITDNGPIRTLSAIGKQYDNHEEEVSVLLTDLSDQMDALLPDATDPTPTP